MAIIVPVVSSSQSLITPGWPMVAVAHANPVADVVAKEAPTVARAHTVASVTIQKAIVQAGHSNNRSV